MLAFDNFANQQISYNIVHHEAIQLLELIVVHQLPDWHQFRKIHTDSLKAYIQQINLATRS